MAPTMFDHYERKSDTYCETCGGYKHSWCGTTGSGRACKHYKDKEVSSGTMPLTGLESYSDNYKREKPLTEKQKQSLWLIERRNQEMKRAWKKDQLYNSRQQMRI